MYEPEAEAVAAEAVAVAEDSAPAEPTYSGPLLEVNNLCTYFRTAAGIAKAVDGVSFQIPQGKTFAIVGESGCGKSVTALSIMQLVPKPGGFSPEGEVRLAGQEILRLPEYQKRKLRGNDISMIFQEPMTSLNPVFTIGMQIVETIREHRDMSYSEAKGLAIDMLEKVRIPDAAKRFNEYPHQLSGGMRQRVMIAIALSCRPKLLIADEPTTALDVTIQAQILDLIAELQAELGMSVLLITHDLAVVRQIADDVAVMYAGKIVEHAEREMLFNNPQHPYTIKLFKSIPSLQNRGTELETIRGAVPRATEYPAGCRFADRCDNVMEGCAQHLPRTLGVTHNHDVACHLYDPRFHGERLNPEQPARSGKIRGTQMVGKREAVLDVSDLKVHFPIRRGLFKHTVGWVYAVDGLDLKIPQGTVTALVGESGCGKTTVGKGILGLIGDAKITGGVNTMGHGEVAHRANGVRFRKKLAAWIATPLSMISFAAAIVATVVYEYPSWLVLAPFALFALIVLLVSKLGNISPIGKLKKFRKDFQIIFQDPYSSLNPRQMVGEIIREGMTVHKIGENATSRDRHSMDLLRTVKLSEQDIYKYPHEFSGGQRQRIGIARALAVDPTFIVCDEATSALDVSVQAQVLNLLAELQDSRELTYLFITHNLGVVEYLADQVCVMYLGRIVEQGTSAEIFGDPKHPYTRALLDAVPQIDATGTLRIKLEGDVPSPINPPKGCHFHPRCPDRLEGVCDVAYPGATPFSESHTARCFRWGAGDIALPAGTVYTPQPLAPYAKPKRGDGERAAYAGAAGAMATADQAYARAQPLPDRTEVIPPGQGPWDAQDSTVDYQPPGDYDPPAEAMPSAEPWPPEDAPPPVAPPSGPTSPYEKPAPEYTDSDPDWTAPGADGGGQDFGDPDEAPPADDQSTGDSGQSDYGIQPFDPDAGGNDDWLQGGGETGDENDPFA